MLRPGLDEEVERRLKEHHKGKQMTDKEMPEEIWLNSVNADVIKSAWKKPDKVHEKMCVPYILKSTVEKELAAYQKAVRELAKALERLVIDGNITGLDAEPGWDCFFIMAKEALSNNKEQISLSNNTVSEKQTTLSNTDEKQSANHIVNVNKMVGEESQ